MDRKTAIREWRDVTRGAPEGAMPTGRTVHVFAQRVEELAISGCDRRHAVALAALRDLLDRYIGLVNCGDCGSWNPEDEQPVIDARAALVRIGAA